MINLRFATATFSAGMMVLSAGVVSAQDYPNKPVRIVAAEAGGSADFLARQIAQGLASSLGQPVLVENIGGAGGVIAVNSVVKAPPDGYTLLFHAAVWLLPLMQKTSFDPAKDLAPITLAASTPNVLVVHPSLPVKSVSELITFAKTKPGDLNYAATGVGSATFLAAALFVALANVNIVNINYKGAPSALSAVIAGEIPMMFPPVSLATPHVKSGRLRALAVTSAEPTALLPGLPPIAATLPGYDQTVKYGVFVPANTPAALVNRLNQEVVRFLNRPDTKERFLNAGSEVVANSQDEFAALIRSDVARIAKVIKDAGIKVE